MTTLTPLTPTQSTLLRAAARRDEARGGRLVRHVFLRRGRVYWQMSRDELLDAVRKAFPAQ
jgi:hypothetical protein